MTILTTKRRPDRPRVVILATGGTIAGTAGTSTKAGYSSGSLDIDRLIRTVPELKRIARISGEQISNVGSQDMSFEIMTRLARKINSLSADKDVHGIVVTHGTDTMEETAYFLNLTVKSPKTVVMTGAMRPATAISADGPLNIYNAAAVAADPKSRDRGVLVVMNDRIHGAHSLTKSNTTSVETFVSPINGLIGTVIYGRTTYFRTPSRAHTVSSRFSPPVTLPLPRVDIVYACADMPPDLIECSAARGAKGIVIAGDGNGNMNAAGIKAAAAMAKKGIWIVRSSRVATGTVDRNMEVDDDLNGFIASDDLNPAKSRILLMLILAFIPDPDPEQVQSFFYEY